MRFWSRAATVAVLVCTLAACQPRGSVDSTSATPDGIRVAGWANDPDTTAPIDVHVYVDGAPVAVSTADGERPDVAQSVVGVGPLSGFEVSVAAAPGRHDVCVYGIDAVGDDGNALIDCRVVTVPSGDPFGAVDQVVEVGSSVEVRGWVIDPNTSASTAVHVYVDGKAIAVATADRTRADLSSVYPGYGDKHGFTVTIPKSGSSVCVYGINSGAGTNASIACRRMPGAPEPVVAPPASSCPNGTYVNVDGDTVCRPYASDDVPAGASARCRDGSYSFSRNRSGTCSGHGGVSRWL